ncbi:hypothetical protein G6F49_011254 [Rhizopus delemar]|nr:hypothetical protein G6F49_011254 [Rhizopus delemar]
MSLSLEHYGLSPVTGFLPSKPPLQRLPDAYFAPWENRLDGLHEALADHSIRKDIQKLPLLDTTRLQTTEEYQRAFLVLCFLSHAYVWGEEEAAKELGTQSKRRKDISTKEPKQGRERNSKRPKQSSTYL